MIAVAHQKLKPGEHGEIFITTHTSGSQQARVRVRLLDGSVTEVSRSRQTAHAARLAVQAEIDTLLNAAKGSENLKPDDKVGKAARQWIDELRVRSRWPNAPVRPQTVDEYERTLGNHVIPALGKIRLNQLTLPMCQKLVDDILEKGKKGPNDMVWTAEQVKFCFKSVIDRAMLHDALRSNPVEKVRTPKPTPPEPKAMKVIDVFRLRKATRDWEASRKGQPGPRPTGHLPAAVDLMLGTGLRIGEALALQWGDVKLTGPTPTVAVVATLVDIKGEGTVRQEQPKSDAGVRTIVIPQFTVEALESIRPPSPEPDMPVFPSRTFKDGRACRTPQTTHNVRRTLRMALELANMKGQVHPHLLRKTVATFVARERGAGDAATLLGHKINTGVTGKHYIERLRLAPDVSDVLQELIQIADEEGLRSEAASQEHLAIARSDGVPPAGVESVGPRAGVASVNEVTGW